MPIIKLVEPGFEGYTGRLSRIDFVNGVSVESMPMRDAERLGNNMKIVDAATGDPLSMTRRMAESESKTAAQLGIEVAVLVPIVRDDSGEAKAVEPEAKQKAVIPPKSEPKIYDYTREQLEEIADKTGITGIREFSKQYGINGRSIVEIIESLLTIKERMALESEKNDDGGV